MRHHHIYILYDNLLGRYFYVGCTIDTVARFKSHQTTFGKTIKMEIIQSIVTTTKNARKAERYWINQFSAWGIRLHNTNCNSTRGIKNYVTAS
jgi:hypothetical protein